MFVPLAYATEDEQWHRRIVRDNPLATLVTNGDAVPFATRLPALFPPGASTETPLRGAEIIGHMNRANPHWAALSDGISGRLMFDGPEGFVSPSVYWDEPAAPTWDFVAVHLIGRLRLVEDSDETLHVVCWTAQTLEDRFGEGWSHASSLGYFRDILPGVGAFRMEIDSVEAMFKLSQEKPADVRASVLTWFEADRDGAGRELARIMRDFDAGAATPAAARDAKQCPA